MSLGTSVKYKIHQKGTGSRSDYSWFTEMCSHRDTYVLLIIKYTCLQLGPTAELKHTENTQIFPLPCTLALQRIFFPLKIEMKGKNPPLLGLDPRQTDSSWELKHLQRSIYKWKDWHDFKYSVIRNLIIQQQVSNWKPQSNILALSCDLILSKLLSQGCLCYLSQAWTAVFVCRLWRD